MAKAYHISAQRLLIDKDIHERLKFADALNPGQLRKAFQEVGIKITSPADLEMLANLHESGQDKAGFMGADGTIYAFDVKDILDRVPVNKELFAKANIQWTDMVRRGANLHILQNEE